MMHWTFQDGGAQGLRPVFCSALFTGSKLKFKSIQTDLSRIIGITYVLNV